jgi:NAD(P)-dependent dehydrogenase (short-subunit alcohol dehydrogenase family)
VYDFTDQVVIVTGGTGNLGGALVRSFYAAGAHIVAPDRSLGRAEELFPDLAGSKDHLLAGGVDVTNPEQMDRLVQEVVSRFDRIDVLVNTVGGYRGGTPVHETPLETWDFLFNLNARSAFIASRAVIPIMLQRKRGKIVSIGSRSALSGQGNEAAYSAAKSAVVRLTESMSAEYKDQGIQVNAILPAALVSSADLQADPKRGVTPDSVAQVVMFLCSEAGSIITGALIPTYGRRF